MEVKVGDILEFAEPLHTWDKKLLDKGARYVARQYHKTKFYQTADGWWHGEELDEFEPIHICLEFSNGSFGYGKLSDFSDRKFKIVGSVF